MAAARASHPLPCGFHNGPGILAPGFPAEDFLGFCRIGDQAGWISFPAGAVADGNLLPGDFFSGFQDFPDGKPQAGTQVEALRGASLHQVVHGFQVGVRQVVHVDVVPDAGAVRSIIIRPENFNVFLLPGQRQQNVGNEVGFRFMALAQLSIRVCACGVEVAQADRLQPVCTVKIFKYLILVKVFIQRHIIQIFIP